MDARSAPDSDFIHPSAALMIDKVDDILEEGVSNREDRTIRSSFGSWQLDGTDEGLRLQRGAPRLLDFVGAGARGARRQVRLALSVSQRRRSAGAERRADSRSVPVADRDGERDREDSPRHRHLPGTGSDGSKRNFRRWAFRGSAAPLARANVSMRCASCGAIRSALIMASS